MLIYYLLFIIVSSPVTSPVITSAAAGHGIFGNVIETISSWIAKFGYPAVFAVSLLENIFPPIPSELVFPLVGFATQTHDLGIMTAIGMAIVGSVGSTVGALIIYIVALKIGLPVIIRIGKRYHILPESDIRKAETWFDKHGELAVFLGRLAPGIRELISIPAGIAKMNIVKFTFFTFIGSCIWSLFLTLVGFFIGNAWIMFYNKYSIIFDVAGITLILVVIVLIVLKYHKSRKE
jgi:membrane protein DedA with SNARE-associated domain